MDVRLKATGYYEQLHDAAGSASRDWWKISATIVGLLFTALQLYNSNKISQAGQKADQAAQKAGQANKSAENAATSASQADQKAGDAADAASAALGLQPSASSTAAVSQFLSATTDSENKANAIVKATGSTAIYIHAMNADRSAALALEASLRQEGYISWVDWENRINETHLDYFRNNTSSDADAMGATIRRAAGFALPLPINARLDINNAKNTYGLWIKSFSDLKGTR